MLHLVIGHGGPKGKAQFLACQTFGDGQAARAEFSLQNLLAMRRHGIVHLRIDPLALQMAHQFVAAGSDDRKHMPHVPHPPGRRIIQIVSCIIGQSVTAGTSQPLPTNAEGISAGNIATAGIVFVQPGKLDREDCGLHFIQPAVQSGEIVNMRLSTTGRSTTPMSSSGICSAAAAALRPPATLR